MSADAKSQFYQSIEALFNGWTALQLAVAHSFGGAHSREKATWFIGAVEQWFNENSDIDSYELEDFLAEIMSDEFNTVVDDNSVAEISVKICLYYDLIKRGNIEELHKKLAGLKKSVDLSSSQRQVAESDDDDEDDVDIVSQNVMNHMNALEIKREPIELQEEKNDKPQDVDDADDGWTVVSSKPNRRRQK